MDSKLLHVLVGALSFALGFYVRQDLDASALVDATTRKVVADMKYEGLANKFSECMTQRDYYKDTVVSMNKSAVKRFDEGQLYIPLDRARRVGRGGRE
jgi:hypothetical protein